MTHEACQACPVNANSFHNKKGASTFEFIICAPILLILMYFSFEINERFEHRISGAIAVENAAWLSKPGEKPNQDSVRADILGFGTDPNKDGRKVLALSPERSKQETYDIYVGTAPSQDVANSAAARAKAKIDDSNFNTVSRSLGLLAEGSRLLETFPLSMIFPQKPVEQFQVTTSISTKSAQNQTVSILNNLATLSRQNDFFFDEKAAQNRLLYHREYFLFRDAAFHPDGYRRQAIIGYPLGLLKLNQNRPDIIGDFRRDCFMYFEKDLTSRCSEINGFYVYVDDFYKEVAAAKAFFYGIQMKSCLAGVNPAAIAGCYLIQDRIYNEMIDIAKTALETWLMDELDAKIKTAINEQIDSVVQDTFQNVITNTDILGSIGNYVSPNFFDNILNNELGL